mmetsp:Transcript_32212/g.72677  ORF Transcript_32212/g.72677 Transcript_32212/m.72677 type:complete len:371 (-) Transcript_32212:316-1428(-)|eukprot:CAMPEP_0172619440 /NCGR_PEP_ID=MMETSP1068-20121228/93421_1 /TAXON_ID=35684 /ORGANISM="Pseudopedinella elastica, Strain CCMP716" /LENGTH=370 /DNA_ID=CAMNT_0013426195 /DNA_START=142 /DNA_END=1254 /DNA_ORIENTATION=-
MAALTRAVRDPQIEIRELEEDRIEFVLSNTDTSVANAIRRVMIAEVKTMAIDRVQFYKNTTALTDEFLAHRLGLIPLNYRYNQEYLNYCSGPETDLGTLGHRFMDNTECDCVDGCYRCCVTFELNVKFGLDEDPLMTKKLVTSKDLKPVALVDDVEMDDVQPVHFSNSVDRENAQDEGILIAKLARGQELHVTCVAILGIGKQHAKWSPASACTFSCDPLISVNAPAMDALSDLDRATVRDSCPVGVFGETARTGGEGEALGAVDPGQALVPKHPSKCMFCGECERRCEELSFGRVDHQLLKVDRDEHKFVFTVETTGALAPEDLVQQALHVIRGKMTSLQEEIQERIDEDTARMEHQGQYSAEYQPPGY